jgi:hypothetical protein
VLVEGQALGEGPLAEPDIVLLGAREVHDGRAPLTLGQQAHIGLHRGLLIALGDTEPPAEADERQTHRALELAADEDLEHGGVVAERLAGGLGVRRGHEDVQVADRLLAAPQRARERGARHTGDGPHPPQDRLGQRHRHADVQPPARGLQERDGLLDVLDRLLAHAGQGQDAAVGDDPLEVGDGRDAALVPQQLDGLGPQAADLQQVEHARGDLGGEFVVLGDDAAFGELGDLGGGALADALDGDQGLGVAGDGLQVRGMVADDPGRLGVGVDPELVGPGQLQHGAHALKDRGELGVETHGGV